MRCRTSIPGLDDGGRQPRVGQIGVPKVPTVLAESVGDTENEGIEAGPSTSSMVLRTVDGL